MLKCLFKFMCRDVLSALFRCSRVVKLHFHARAKTLRHMAREKCKQIFKNVHFFADQHRCILSFDSLVNTAVSTCCVLTPYFELACAGWWDISRCEDWNCESVHLFIKNNLHLLIVGMSIYHDTRLPRYKKITRFTPTCLAFTSGLLKADPSFSQQKRGLSC